MKTIDKNELSSVIQSGRALVDFYADWCAECVALTPYLEAAEKESDIPFFRFDCDSDRDFVSGLGIMSIPVLILYENGKEICRRVGLCDKDEILSITKQDFS